MADDASYRLKVGSGRRRRGVDLGGADARGGVGDLALQVGQFHHIVVHDAEPADAGGGEVEHQRTAQPAGAHHQHAGVPQAGLAGPAHLRQQDVPRVAAYFFVIEIEAHRFSIGGRRRATKTRIRGLRGL